MYFIQNSYVNCCLLLLAHKFHSIQVLSQAAYLMSDLFVYASQYRTNGASFKMIIDDTTYTEPNQTKPHIYYSGRSSFRSVCEFVFVFVRLFDFI